MSEVTEGVDVLGVPVVRAPARLLPGDRAGGSGRRWGLTAATAGLATLAAVDLLSLWPAEPVAGDRWFVYWALFSGAGFAVAGLTALRSAGAGRRDRAAGQVLLAAAVLLLTPAAEVLGLAAVGRAAGTLGLAVGVPWAVFGIVRPAGPAPAVRAVAVMRGSTVVAGLVGTTAAVLELWPLLTVTILVGGITAVCAGWVLFEITVGDQRRQVLWVVVGVGLAAVLGTLVLMTANRSAGGVAVLFAVVTLFVPLSVGIALVSPRSVDVRAVISRGALITVMLTFSVAVFCGAVAVGELLVGGRLNRSVEGLIAGAIAAAFHPVLVQAGQTMDELLFGGRADPVETLTRLGQDLAGSTTPQEWLDTLRSALAVPGLLLRHEGEVLARSGDLVSGPSTTTRLLAGSTEVAELEVALPPDRLRLPPTTQAVLALVAAPLAQALHAARLTEQVQASRGRVVAALEEERRRVRRDLHDGLGPTLTGIAYSADAASNLLLAKDPAAAGAVLSELRVDAGEAITEIRRIVYGLRPRALDELGLIGAVRQRVSRLRAADGSPLDLAWTVPPGLPDLPAAVEVVAYRVAVEAVTNVARHAGSATVGVSFALLPVDGDPPELEITVQDSGVARPEGGAGPGWRPGVGLTAMRERVEQIGGRLSAGPGLSGGEVRAVMPTRLPIGG